MNLRDPGDVKAMALESPILGCVMAAWNEMADSGLEFDGLLITSDNLAEMMCSMSLETMQAVFAVPDEIPGKWSNAGEAFRLAGMAVRCYDSEAQLRLGLSGCLNLYPGLRWLVVVANPNTL